jgi:hypothetical protein
MPCEIFDNLYLNNYIYSVGLKAYYVPDADHYDVILLKSDTLGNLIWLKNYGGTSMDWGWKIINTYDNNIILATLRSGYYTANNPYYTKDHQWWILKLDTAGNVIWTKNFGHPDIRDGRPVGLIETSDSCYIITGSYAIEMYGSAEKLRGRILKIDKNGNYVWDKLYGHKASETYTGIIKEYNNKDLIVIHNEGWYSTENQTIYNPIILRLTQTGELKWFRKYHFYNKPHADASVLNTFDFTNDGGYIFAGFGMDYDSIPAQRSWVIKTDSLGFDGVTDFASDTTYRMEQVSDTCYNDTMVAYVQLYGVTGPYSITYTGFATHDSLYYSPMFYPYVADSLIITDNMLSGNDTIINIVCNITDGLSRQLIDTISLNVSCLVSLKNELIQKDEIMIYPNPANNELTISVTDKNLLIEEVEILDIAGKIIIQVPLAYHSRVNGNPPSDNKEIDSYRDRNEIKIDIKDISAGVYFVKANIYNRIIIKKFVKQ